MKKLILFGLFLALTHTASYAETPAPKKGLFLNDARLIPTLHGGRLKPFDEFARESVLSITGSRSFGDFEPTEMVISMLTEPQKWLDSPIIRINIEDVRKQLLVDADRKFFSPQELLKNNTFLQYAEGITNTGTSSQVTDGGMNVQEARKNPRGEELRRVVERVSYFQALVQGKMWAVSPPADKNPQTAWGTLADGMTAQTPQTQAMYEMLKAYMDQDLDQFKFKAAAARKAVEEATPQFEAAKTSLMIEVLYNKFRPFLQVMILYLIAGLLWMMSSMHAVARQMAKFLTFAAVAVHTIGFAMRCYVAGRPPVSNMYESVIWVSLGVMAFAIVIYAKYKQPILMTTSTILSGLVLFAADSAPLIMDPTIRPLTSVLRSNYWLTVHVLTITLSYAAFMLAMGISNITLFQFYKKARSTEATTAISQKIALLNQLSYRAIQFGVVLLAAGTILGGIWADYSWGRFWGWDPKEVWALIALLAYLAVLHGRFAGWVGTFAFPLWSVLCFSTVVMAWYGVNFVLGIGKHTYGISAGGQGVVGLFLLLQFIYCAWVAFENKKSHA